MAREVDLLLWLLALAPIGGLALNVAVQVAWCRWRRPPQLLRSVVIGFSAALVAVLAVTTLAAFWAQLAPIEIAAQVTVNLMTTVLLGYGYFNFINLGETARRVRILREVVEAGGCLSEEELLRRYGAQEMVARRLGRLLSKGQVVVREGRYHLGRRTVLRMAQAVEWLRFLIGMGRRDPPL